MPEDVRPDLPRDSRELCLYLTLPMALNYQRNSYALWRGATMAYDDPETVDIFDPFAVVQMDTATLWAKLSKYKVGLQQTRHPKIWRTICETLVHEFNGDVRILFQKYDRDIFKILNAICVMHKAGFPYLSGPKISNYWLYVMSSYTDVGLVNRGALSIAPDTHVIQSSHQLGLIDDRAMPSVHVATVWKDFLTGTGLDPIDIHTPLWLWSRGGFQLIDKIEVAQDDNFKTNIKTKYHVFGKDISDRKSRNERRAGYKNI